MTVAIVAGVVLGIGLFALVRWLFPARPSLEASLAALRGGMLPAGASVVLPPAANEGSRFRLGLGRAVGPMFGQLGLERPSLRKDLIVVGRSFESLLGEKVLFTLGALILVPATVAAMGLGGVHLPVLIPLWISPGLALVGWFVPDLGLRSTAEERRRGFRHATGAFLDLVSINLAGGAGIESALESGMNVGEGWAFARIREALARARDAGETPWVALGRLGDELGVHELRELAASLVLAGNEGAKVRGSIAAKAAALRRRELAEVETEAASTTERMVLPIGLLFLGFMLFLGFPAVIRVLTGV